MSSAQTKNCNQCGQSKSHDQFSRNTAARDGLYSYCKPCARALNSAYRASNADKIKQKDAAYKASYKTGNFDRLAKRLLSAARSSSRRRGHSAPTLTHEQLLTMLQTQAHCAVTGLPFIYSPESRHPHAPSLDRINNDLGYTPDNVRLVTWQANLAMNIYDDATFLQMCRAAVAKADNDNAAEYLLSCLEAEQATMQRSA